MTARERVTGMGGIDVESPDHTARKQRHQARLRAPVDDTVADYPCGRFGRATDLDGTRIELWEPPGGS